MTLFVAMVSIQIVRIQNSHWNNIAVKPVPSNHKHQTMMAAMLKGVIAEATRELQGEVAQLKDGLAETDDRITIMLKVKHLLFGKAVFTLFTLFLPHSLQTLKSEKLITEKWLTNTNRKLEADRGSTLLCQAMDFTLHSAQLMREGYWYCLLELVIPRNQYCLWFINHSRRLLHCDVCRRYKQTTIVWTTLTTPLTMTSKFFIHCQQSFVFGKPFYLTFITF